jgi:hypothetical protein
VFYKLFDLYVFDPLFDHPITFTDVDYVESDEIIQKRTELKKLLQETTEHYDKIKQLNI